MATGQLESFTGSSEFGLGDHDKNNRQQQQTRKRNLLASLAALDQARYRARRLDNGALQREWLTASYEQPQLGTTSMLTMRKEQPELLRPADEPLVAGDLPRVARQVWPPTAERIPIREDEPPSSDITTWTPWKAQHVAFVIRSHDSDY